MRHPRLFRFLLWAGSTSFVFVAGSLELVAQLSQAYVGFHDWSAAEFADWQATVSLFWFLAGGVAFIFSYLGALFYCASPPRKKPMVISDEAMRS